MAARLQTPLVEGLSVAPPESRGGDSTGLIQRVVSVSPHDAGGGTWMGPTCTEGRTFDAEAEVVDRLEKAAAEARAAQRDSEAATVALQARLRVGSEMLAALESQMNRAEAIISRLAAMESAAEADRGDAESATELREMNASLRQQWQRLSTTMHETAAFMQTALSGGKPAGESSDHATRQAAVNDHPAETRLRLAGYAPPA